MPSAKLAGFLPPRSGAASGPLPGTGIGFGPLATYRQPLAVPQATIAPEIHEPFDVHGHFPAAITLNCKITFNDLADGGYIAVVQVIALHVESEIGPLQDLARSSAADAVDISQSNLHVLALR